MRRVPLFIGFLLSLSLSGQTPGSESLDVERPVSESLVNEQIQLGKKQQWIDPHKALGYADRALAMAAEIGYPLGIASAQNLQGFCHWTFGDNELAIQSAMEALEIAQREHFPDNRS